MELEPGIDHRDQSSGTKTLMPTEGGTSPDPRLRLNRGQWALAVVALLMIIALVATNWAASATQRRYTETFARTESVGNNLSYTMREALSYIDESERYLLGFASRRDVQMVRAMLGRRLSVVDGQGIPVGDSVPPEFRASLTALDDAIGQMPPGVLPVGERERWATIVLPRTEALSEAARHLADSTAAQLHTDARASNSALLRSRFINLVLLIATLLVGAALLAWVAADVGRQYRAARRALDQERQELQATKKRLAQVSFLDRAQAHLLQQIATGEALSTVLRQVAELAASVSGQHAVRISAGTLSVTQPPHADVSRTPAWSRTFHAATTNTVGAFEVFGDASALDESARTAFLRCRDLVSLALEREASAAKLAQQANRDALTGLANRSLLLTRLADSLAAIGDGGAQLALLFCDLDRFKMVNDSLGHAAGDQLLIKAAQRLSSATRDTDTVARLGGDEFVILCPDLPDREYGVALAERVHTALSAPYNLDGKEAFVGTSIGLTFADSDTESAAELMREADVAMYRAKLTEGNHINVYDAHLEAEVAERLDLDAALRRALERDQLRVGAQPLVMLDTGAVTGFELLLQWNRPGLPHLSPDMFIPLAEDNGMIVEIGHWVLEEGIRNLAEWRAAGLAHGLTISVNVTARQVREPGFADEVLALLRSANVPPDALIIELTEHALVDVKVAHEVLGRLREAGVRVSLDDFGTGYSSLTQLRSLPVDQIKLDRSFVADIDEANNKQRAVVQSVVALAKALALDLVVEGVETIAERDTLIAMGAMHAQGFLYRRAMTFDAARELLEAGGVCSISVAPLEVRSGATP